jgi:hypothetical protein
MLGLAPALAETAAPQLLRQLLRSVGQSRHLLMGLGHHHGLSYVGGKPEGDNTGEGGIALGCAYPLRSQPPVAVLSGCVMLWKPKMHVEVLRLRSTPGRETASVFRRGTVGIGGHVSLHRGNIPGCAVICILLAPTWVSLAFMHIPMGSD